MNFYSVFGFIGMIAWLAGAVLLVLADWIAFKEMPLNEKGDFFAGVFAPVAFLWLVLGYFQQGRDLRLNTKALRAQLRELALQVESTKDLASSAKKQAEIAEENHNFDKQKYEYELSEKKEMHRKEIEPVLDVICTSQYLSDARFQIRNLGADALDISLSSKYKHQYFGNRSKLSKDGMLEVGINFSNYTNEKVLNFSVVCSDRERQQHHFYFEVFFSNGYVSSVIQNYPIQ